MVFMRQMCVKKIVCFDWDEKFAYLLYIGVHSVGARRELLLNYSFAFVQLFLCALHMRRNVKCVWLSAKHEG